MIVLPAVNWLVPIYVQCTWVERGFKMSCPRTQHSASASARTQTIRSGANRTKDNRVHDCLMYCIQSLVKMDFMNWLICIRVLASYLYVYFMSMYLLFVKLLSEFLIFGRNCLS